jgi:hypothetical protein
MSAKTGAWQHLYSSYLQGPFKCRMCPGVEETNQTEKADDMLVAGTI